MKATRLFGSSRLSTALPWKHSATPYDILGLSRSASPKEIKTKYYELAFSRHPDKNLDKSPSAQDKIQQEFSAIQDAYDVLKDETARREYDMYGDAGLFGSMHNQPANFYDNESSDHDPTNRENYCIDGVRDDENLSQKAEYNE
ncbi:DnaJ sub B member 13 [Physocladia obscura]|uniref:DnaJ sub B member 13 n=1 Tax=Physocladia obscura TaxID=109957 RepID=A0AAD5XEH0_9FUNG|nr:DnaJ sub B member 13 [Physocladia obscura]